MSFFLLIRLPPTSTLFPYTTLFRSDLFSCFKRNLIFLCVLRGHAVRAHERNAEHLHRHGHGIGGELAAARAHAGTRSEEHTSELQSRFDLVCRLLLEKKKNILIATP